ncbi:MAG TPA: PAS domain S-box protein [Candidatus Limnocylindria bacterium]|nr:PAS domain S-box protein [Candidatus Limnocylindria bacterium]
MAFVSNPGFLAVAFIEASAAFILLVLYWLLAPGFPARFFRIWMAGWALYIGLGGLRIYSLWRGGTDDPRFGPALSSLAAALFFAAILQCAGKGRRLNWFWPLAAVSACALLALSSVTRAPDAAIWAESMFGCALYLIAGWVLWRSHSQHHGFGWKLLAGALLLRGLHGLDRPDWPIQTLGLFRVSLHGLFGIAMGIAMAVLVLEAGRARTEDLNEKLRRLALITAEATQSLRIHEALEGVLRHVVESFNASHGLVLLLQDSGDSASLVIRASVGFSDLFLKRNSRVYPQDSWVQKLLQQEIPFVAYATTDDSGVRGWMESEQLVSLVLVRVPGKDGSLGLLGIGSNVQRTFETDEIHFLVNVANLLGLTAQNVALFEMAATSRRQWLDTFDSIGDLIVVHGPDGRILRANRALAWHLGVEPASLEGQALRDLLTQGGRRWNSCPYCEGAAGKPEEVDASFGGHFLVTNSDFHDSEGNRLGTIHVLKDYTERRQAENKFRMLFENVQEGIFISTPEGHFLDFNKVFMEIVGYDSRDELIQADIPATFYVDPADRERLKRLLREHGQVNDFEFQFRRRDGEIRTAHESSFATRDESGAITAYQGFVLDVTERKHAEMEIRRRNRELLALNSIAELLGESGPLEDVLTRALVKVAELLVVDTGALYLLDDAGKILKRVAGVGHRSEEGRHIRPIEISSSLLEQVRQARATVLSGSALAAPEYLRALQEKEAVQDTQVAILWSKDRVLGALVVGCRSRREFSTAELNLLAALANQIAATIDKSVLLEETRDAYDSLRCAQEQLLQSEKMAAVGQLISGVAHELNNPLTAILGYSQLLKSEELMNARGADYLEKLYKQAQRTHHIVQNLLSFARQHKPERTPVDLNQILQDTLTLREYDMNLNNIRIHRQFSDNLPPIGGDFHQLQQVFLNILNNAVDAIGEKGGKGEIWVRTDVVGNRVRTEITDSGSGVQNPHRVFDPFYTTKPVGKGTGLGLSICYGIVKEHGGEIQVRNSAPRGATFAILLPTLSADRPVEQKHPSRVRESIAAKVLLVDDEETVLQLEHEVLRARGVTLKLARSGKEAVDLLRRETVDAIVTDMKMTGEISAIAMYQWIQQNRPELSGRVVFTASNGHKNEAIASLRRSGCLVVSKPFAIEQLWEAVQKVLTAEVSSGLKR